MTVDDALRTYAASIPAPRDDLAAEIVSSTVTGKRPAVGMRRRPSARTVLVAATVAAAIVVIVALGALVRGGGRPDAVPATPTIPPARVDWGMVATVKLVPDSGVSIEEMRERFARALAFRVAEDDGAGVEVLGGTGDTVRVRLPGAEVGEQARQYLRFSRLVMVDESSGVLAQGKRLRDLRAAATTLVAPGMEPVYYVQLRTSAAELNDLMRATTRKNALRYLRSGPSDKAEMIAVPPSTIVSATERGSGGILQLIRASGGHPSRSILDVDRRDDGTRITVDPASAPPEPAQVLIFVDESGTGRLGGLAQRLGSGTLGPDGQVDLPPEAAWMLRSVPRVDIGGRVAYQGATRYGKRPPLPGREFERPKGRTVYSTSFATPQARDASRWVRLAEGRQGKRDLVMEGAENDGVVSAVVVRDHNSSRDSLGSSRVVYRDPVTNERIDSACPGSFVGSPRVSVCSGSGYSIMGTAGKEIYRVINYGTVDSSVGRIVLEWEGSQQTAVIQNGWWFVTMSIEVRTASGSASSFLSPRPSREMPRLTAIGKDGKPIPVPSRRDRL